MSAFYDNNITDVGRLLMADIQMGAKFVPTKIVIGKGYMPVGKTTRTMTDVAEVVAELSLNKATKTPDGSAIFGAIFTNEQITQPFYYRELAMYAKGVYDEGRETEEILYSYGNAGDNAELIPAYSTGSAIERQLDLIVYIGNDTEVKLEIETGLYVTIHVFNETVDRLEKEIEEVRYIIDDVTKEKYRWKMSSGDLSLKNVTGTREVRIADKETQDAIKNSIGAATDSGGTSSVGSIFAKLNNVITNLTAHIMQWTADRAAKIDTIDTNSATASTKATEAANYGSEIKTQVAVNNTPSKTGTLSQKATQIINDLATVKTAVEKGGKVLVSKRTTLRINSAGKYTLVNVSGSGEFYNCRIYSAYITDIAVMIDGVQYNIGKPTGLYFMNHSPLSERYFRFGKNLNDMIPIKFKKSLVITFSQIKTDVAVPCICDYALYE